MRVQVDTGASPACRLPVEVLSQILSYLDVAALRSLSAVSRMFHRLANHKSEPPDSPGSSADDQLTLCRRSNVWRKIYTSHFGSRWKPKTAGVVVLKAEPEEAGLGHWKKQHLWKTL